MFYQKSLKEVKIGIIGPGTSFGDIDASRNRHYMYTLRTASIRCKIFEINASDFICFIKSHGKENQFNKWALEKDQQLINVLASGVFFSFRGMNVDRASDHLHKNFYVSSKSEYNIPILHNDRYVAINQAAIQQPPSKEALARLREMDEDLIENIDGIKVQDLDIEKKTSKGESALLSRRQKEMRRKRKSLLHADEVSEPSTINIGEEIKQDDPIDIILANNPGNFKRKKAVAVDLSEVE